MRLSKRYLALTFVFATPALTLAQENTPVPRVAHTLAIVGEGQYFVTPEIAEFSGSIVTKGPTLDKARDPHPKQVQAATATMKSLEAQGLKLEHSKYSIEETHPYRYVTDSQLSDQEKERPVFVATTDFAMSTSNLADLSQIVTKLAAGDLRISNIHFTVKDERGPLLEARKDAARDAVDQAKAYAEALGIKLVDIRDVTDGEASPPDYGEADLMIPTPPEGKPDLTIQVPDQLTYNARVNVDWTIASTASEQQ